MIISGHRITDPLSKSTCDTYRHLITCHENLWTLQRYTLKRRIRKRYPVSYKGLLLCLRRGLEVPYPLSQNSLAQDLLYSWSTVRVGVDPLDHHRSESVNKSFINTSWSKYSPGLNSIHFRTLVEIVRHGGWGWFGWWITLSCNSGSLIPTHRVSNSLNRVIVGELLFLS